MASSGNSRNPTYPERRSAPPRPRAPSGSFPESSKRNSDNPQQSSIMPQTIRQAASSHKPNGEGNYQAEKRIEKTHVVTRENMSIKNKSPVKEGSNPEFLGHRIDRIDRERERLKAGGRASADIKAVQKHGREIQQATWTPQASLIPHTTAPLACRVSIPPLASQAPLSLQPCSLSQLSIETQEAAILEDLLFVFMGFEGQYIRFVDTYNPSLEKDRLAGPQFKILPGLDPSLLDLATRMLKLATYYSAVEAFVEVQSREEFGLVNHALCAAIRKLLKDYIILLTQLEHQFLTNPTFTMNVLHLHTLPTAKMLFQLYSLSTEILRKNSMLEENLDDSLDELDDVENILESLREGGDIGSGKKICKGGNVLGLLTTRLASMSGDPEARTLLTLLLREASKPYMVMLNEWLHHGGIKDPHSEFLIKEQKSIRREKLEEDYTDEYWEKRYTIRENDVPPQLESVKEKVLLAGKYLNVVRECGGVDVSKVVKDIPKSFDDVRFLDNVNAAYAHANSSLLNLLLTTHALPARLRSLKHYFFLDRSDFFSYFLELGASELAQPVRKVNVNKLQSLFDLVLRQPGSVAAEDPFKEDVKVQMNEVGLTSWLMRVVSVSGLEPDGTVPGSAITGSTSRHPTPTTIVTSADTSSIVEEIKGFSALELDYIVPFPLSLVISRKTVLRYQLLFRFLLSLRHLETQLAGSWLEHSKLRSWKHRSSDRKLELWKRKAWTLRARMLAFVQQVLYFCTAEVIEPNWRGLMARLGSNGTTSDNSGLKEYSQGGSENGSPRIVTRTVDELMQDHVDFLDTCLKECMLTNSKLLKIHSKLIATCFMFAKYSADLSKVIISADPDLSSRDPQPPTEPTSTASKNSTVAPSKTTTYNPARLERLIDNLQRYEDNFGRHLKILLDVLNYTAATETVVLLGLCARLSTVIEGSS
ncbi:MAG: hypothetical protein M1829_006662 [Trizodia sp. TS-e1964]|nr:MAG: hypothetical protein M1829_006662 [Trizodia sp. TS-e1964]